MPIQSHERVERLPQRELTIAVEDKQGQIEEITVPIVIALLGDAAFRREELFIETEHQYVALRERIIDTLATTILEDGPMVPDELMSASEGESHFSITLDISHEPELWAAIDTLKSEFLRDKNDVFWIMQPTIALIPNNFFLYGAQVDERRVQMEKSHGMYRIRGVMLTEDGMLQVMMSRVKNTQTVA